ncbi:MAG TPA: UDP binding domain-containing protein, partial [Oligoflexia bacterium]|nr:UDP binding domain-containing protein [Oligoflexia bacterium]
KGKNLAVWGLAFKPNTDDMREAPSLIILPKLLEAGASIRAFDPVATHEAQKHLPKSAALTFHDNMYEALNGADALIIVTEWNEFRNPDFARVKATMKNPLIFDGRNVYQTESVRANGFTYYSIGRQ